MAYSTILAKIKTYMSEITNIGNVHDYVRWHKDWPTMLTLFKSTTPANQIRFWDISRVKTPEVNKVSKENARVHTFRLRGFMSLDDSAATEKTFQDLIEAVCMKFRNKPTFEGDAVNVSPVQVESVSHAMVGEVLCHSVECTIEIEEAITWTE